MTIDLGLLVIFALLGAAIYGSFHSGKKNDDNGSFVICIILSVGAVIAAAQYSPAYIVVSVLEIALGAAAAKHLINRKDK